MKMLILVSLIATFLYQVKTTAQDPVAYYNLYNGDATNDRNASLPLTGLDGYTFDQGVRYAGDTTNKAIDLNSDTTVIQAPNDFMPGFLGDYFVSIWVKLVIPSSLSVQTIFTIEYNSGGDALKLDIDYTDGNKLKALYNFTTLDAGSLTSFNDTWVHIGVEQANNTGQLYVNGVAHGSNTSAYASIGSGFKATLGSLGNGSQPIEGSIAEFAVYGTEFYSEYYNNNATIAPLPAQPLNSKVPIASACPANTSEWNIGNDAANRYCIHDTCAERMHDLIAYVQNNLTISTNTTGLNWEDQVNFDYTISQMDCGSGSDEECFIDECFSHTIILADDSDYNVTIPNPIDITYPSETGFYLENYHNDTNCAHTANSSTCYFVFPFFFSGIVDTAAFTRDFALIDLEFTIEYAKVPGEDTISATLIDQSFDTVTYTEAVDVEANIENTAQDLAGATLAFEGGAPSEILIGDELTLVFQAPANHTERDFKNGTFEVDLVFTSNGTEVVIPVTPENVTYVNDGNVTDGADRSVEFTINANYLGTYTIRASATLESEARRRLLQEVTEESSLNSKIKITVSQPKTNQSNNYLVLIATISLVLIVAQNVYLRSKKQEKAIKYEQAQQDTKA